ncbi:MAG: ABC transporter ATP-binding protein [Planctomycetaceae bacterium]
MTSPTTADLEVRELTKQFPAADGALHILSGVDLQLRRGDSVAITGPSGSGKSTLLYIIGLLDTPTSGSVMIDGQQPLSLSIADQAAFRNRKIGFVFQDHHLLPQCTVLENVLLPVLAEPSSADRNSQARALLQRVGLGQRLDHRPAQLSGGERQRVAVCRALINDPLLLLADEPTGNLDRQTAEGIGSLLLEIAAEHRAMLICVTHSTELAARFPRQLLLQDGQLV